jgi:DNA-binding LacI/PurR family transcriptional regulator
MTLKEAQISQRARQAPVSSADVARLAGVSRSAVSRAFTPGAYIAPETRAKVMRAAELLHYNPNALARGLSRRRSGLVGVIVSSLDNPFYAQMLDALSRGLQARDLGVHLLVSDSARIDTLIPRLLSYQVDGVMLPAVTLSSTMASALRRAQRPVVLVNRTVDHEMVSSVVGDNLGGGKAVADLLVATGCRRVAYMGGQPDTSSSRDRGLGLQAGLAAHGLPLAAREDGGYTHEGGGKAARRLLARAPRPDAIFCANDVMAMATVEVARVEFGLRIPDDLSIVGYDNTAPSGWPLHGLTTVDQDLDQMASLAVELLMSMLNGDLADVRRIVVPARLVARQTTRPQTR